MRILRNGNSEKWELRNSGKWEFGNSGKWEFGNSGKWEFGNSGKWEFWEMGMSYREVDLSKFNLNPQVSCS